MHLGGVRVRPDLLLVANRTNYVIEMEKEHTPHDAMHF